MKNFHININGEPEKKRVEHLVDVGTHYFFDMAEGGKLIARRLIPVRYIGAY